MISGRPFSPLCDLHHVAMRRLMLEEDSEKIRSFHECERRDCVRVFRERDGYSDWVDRRFDHSRGLRKTCPHCHAALYLSEVDRTRKIETWECAHNACAFSQQFPSPSGR